MDSIGKFLKKVSADDRQKLLEAVGMIVAGTFEGLDVRKLKGYEQVFRVRVGKHRIICRQIADGYLITSIGRRNDTTYWQ